MQNVGVVKDDQGPEHFCLVSDPKRLDDIERPIGGNGCLLDIFDPRWQQGGGDSINCKFNLLGAPVQLGPSRSTDARHCRTGIGSRFDAHPVNRHSGSVDVPQPPQQGTGLEKRNHQTGLDLARIRELPEFPVLGLQRNPASKQRRTIVANRPTRGERIDHCCPVRTAATTQQCLECLVLEEFSECCLSTS